MTAFPFDSLVSLATLAGLAAPATPTSSAISARDILAAPVYERVRPRYYRLMTELRRHRRMRLSPQVSILFECRETVLCQIHEVLRIEGHSPAHVHREIEQYACLVPQRGELRACVMIDDGTRDECLALAAALRRPGAVMVTLDGMRCGSTILSATGDPDDAVHYLRLRPAPGFASALRRPAAALELALHADERRFVTFAHHGLRTQLQSDLGPPPPRSLLHTLVACPWLLNPTESTSPWPL